MKCWGNVKCIQRISMAAVVLAFMLNFILTANAATTLRISFVKQEKTNWCWAATALMTGKCVYPSAVANQTQIVGYVKGSPVNEPATVDETANGTWYVTNEQIGFSGMRSSLSFSKIKDYINKSRPIQPLVNDGNSGHYYVIYGYNETSSGNYLYIVDPWDGYGKYVLYSNFLNGTWNDSRPWKYSVV